MIRLGTAALAVATLTWAQDAPPVTAQSQDAPPPSEQSQANPPAPPQPAPNAPSQDGWRRLGTPAPGQYGAPAGQYNPGQYNQPGPPPNYNPPPPPPPIPASLTIAPGSFFTIRTSQPLSSDHSKVGDVFTATLAKPLIVNGVVVAERGQTLAGRVSEVDKGGLLKGSTKLGIELTELTLADGTQIPVHSQLISISGPGSGGRNAAIIGSSTVVGAAVGGAVGAGSGAAIGAGAGAAAGILGAIATRGYPTIIRPEALLTFRVNDPIVVATDRAPQAFRYAGPADYSQPAQPTLVRRPPPYYGAGYYPYAPYPYYGYPYYPGIGIGIGFGGRWR